MDTFSEQFPPLSMNVHMGTMPRPGSVYVPKSADPGPVTHPLWLSCRNTTVMSPYTSKFELLKQYLVEFWTTKTNKYGNFISGPEYEYYEKHIKDPFNYKTSDFHKCNLDHIDIAPGFPKAYRNDNGDIYAIQLRPLTNKYLLLGCGNNPTTVCYHNPINMTEWSDNCMTCFKDMPEWGKGLIEQQLRLNKYGETHIHEGYDTIDPQVEMNPTIIGFFGDTKMPFIKDNSYDIIELEGICLGKTLFFDDEYTRIISK